jgi:hypothetical protein
MILVPSLPLSKVSKRGDTDLWEATGPWEETTTRWGSNKVLLLEWCWGWLINPLELDRRTVKSIVDKFMVAECCAWNTLDTGWLLSLSIYEEKKGLVSWLESIDREEKVQRLPPKIINIDRRFPSDQSSQSPHRCRHSYRVSSKDRITLSQATRSICMETLLPGGGKITCKSWDKMKDGRMTRHHGQLSIWRRLRLTVICSLSNLSLENCQECEEAYDSFLWWWCEENNVSFATTMSLP